MQEQSGGEEPTPAPPQDAPAPEAATNAAKLFPHAATKQLTKLNEQINLMAQQRHNFVVGVLTGLGFDPETDDVEINYESMTYTVKPKAEQTAGE